MIPGSVATYAVRVHNRRRKGRRNISSLWNTHLRTSLTPVGGGKTLAIQVPEPKLRQVREVRRGKTKVLRIPVRVPGRLAQTTVRRVCVSAVALPDSARPDSARACSAIHQ